MEKDFRIGLIAGVIFVIGALIWVATRPSLSPEGRWREAGSPSPSQGARASEASPAAPQEEATPRQTLPPGVIPAEPKKPTAPGIASLEPVTTAQEPEPAQADQPNRPDLTVYEQQEKIQTTKFHIVRRNESLSSISKLYYGTPNRWEKILRANRDAIKDPNKISPGTKLIIPE